MPRTCKGPRLIAYALFRSYAIVTAFVGLHRDLGPVPSKVLGELAMVGIRVDA